MVFLCSYRPDLEKLSGGCSQNQTYKFLALINRNIFKIPQMFLPFKRDSRELALSTLVNQQISLQFVTSAYFIVYK